MKRTEFVAIDDRVGICRAQQLIHSRVDRAHGVFVEHPPRHAALIAHDDGGETQRPSPRDGVGGTVHQDDAAGVAQILVAEQERVVAIKKDGRPFHRQSIIDAIRRGSTSESCD